MITNSKCSDDDQIKWTKSIFGIATPEWVVEPDVCAIARTVRRVFELEEVTRIVISIASILHEPETPRFLELKVK